jgi:ketosteroid isomerase-like protein
VGTNHESEVWAFLHRHLTSIFAGDWDTYRETTADDLGLYEHFVTKHRIDGLDFHRFMIENTWATREAKEWRYDLLEPRLQAYGDAVIVSYALMLSVASTEGITHRTHNETRILVKQDGAWKVVHVHKSPA